TTPISAVMFTFTSVPSRVLTLSVLPSMLSMVPRMRVGVGGCWATAADANTETTASEVSSERGSQEEVVGMIDPQGFGSNGSSQYPAAAELFRQRGRRCPTYVRVRRSLHRR